MKTMRIYIFISVVAVSLGLISCDAKDELTNASAGSQQIEESGFIQSVEVVKLEQRSFVAELLISGTAKPNQQVIVYAMESGYVKSIKKEIGDQVKKGELIAVLSNPEVARLYEQKKVQMDVNKSTYERLKSTYDKTPSITPKQILEEAEANYLKLKAEVGAVSDRLGFLSIRAPFAGVITKKLVDNGALVQSGLTENNPQGIVEIQETSIIRLTMPLPESDVASVKPGMNTTVLFPELPGESFNAVVSRTAGALDPASKTMQVEIDLDNAEGLIKPGMYARIKMQVSSQKGVLSLPVTAQWIYQNQPFILVVNNNIVERIPLRKGLANKDYFEVLNGELAAESLIITQGKGLVRPGQEVKPVLSAK
ncbi:MAG: RND family efflux transporter MFP subunit [Parvicellaceae bacterium]|jgi:RND family efflux transporter MFP subunit